MGSMSALVANKKAYFTYEITEKLDAGIELFGHEVKSLRAGQGSLEGAFVSVRGNEAYLIGATIAPYQVNNISKEYDPTRARRLLLQREEINRLTGLESAKGAHAVPLEFFLKNNLIKLSIGIGRHKNQHDKRETIKKRETQRELRREMNA